MEKELLIKEDGRYIVFYYATPVEERTGTADRDRGQSALRERDERAGED